MTILILIMVCLIPLPGFAADVDVNVKNKVDQQQSMTGGTQSLQLNQEGGKIPRQLPGIGDVILPQALPWTAGDRSTSPGMVPPQVLLQFGAEFTYAQLEAYVNDGGGYDMYAAFQIPEKSGWSQNDKIRFIFAWPQIRDQSGKPVVDQFGLPVHIVPPKQIGHINAYATKTSNKQMMGNLARAGMRAIRHGVQFLFVAAYGSERELVAKMLSAMLGGGVVTISSGESTGSMAFGGIGGAIGWAKTPDKPWVQLIALQGELPPQKLAMAQPVREEKPRAEAAPPPPPPPVAPKPSCAECEARARELEQEKNAIQQQFDELVAKEKEPLLAGENCHVTIEFPFNQWDLDKTDHTGKDYRPEKRQFPVFAQCIADNWKKIDGGKIGQFVIDATADERGGGKASGENTLPDRINDVLAFQRANYTRGHVADILRKKHGFTSAQIQRVYTLSVGKRWPLIKGAKNEDQHQKNRRAYIFVAVPGIYGYASK